jgi:hypothetical protein
VAISASTKVVDGKAVTGMADVEIAHDRADYVLITALTKLVMLW